MIELNNDLVKGFIAGTAVGALVVGGGVGVARLSRKLKNRKINKENLKKVQVVIDPSATQNP